MLVDPLIRYKILQEELEVLQGRVRPHSTGHIRTAISVLTERCEEIMGELPPELKTWAVLSNK
jgi:hypothetical protein